MAATLEHRGPDDAGVWLDNDAGIALGHRRLSIQDLSSAGHQPMQSACGRYVLSFNGEIYNFRTLRSELESLGHCFGGHSDTEVMLAAFTEWGLDCAIQRFNGMFAFALWDRNSRRLSLARDRMGEKPLYYGWMGKAFVFGSELKALRAHTAFYGQIDRQALLLYVRYSYIPTPYSIYRGISKLEPGSILTLHAGQPKATPQIRKYWSLQETAQQALADRFIGPAGEAADELQALLEDSVRLRTISDVPCGVLLSGGIDSSTIAALMSLHSSRPVHTFTLGFEDPDWDEAPHARRVARHLATHHTEDCLREQDAFRLTACIPALYDEPFADSSQLPTFFLSRLARRDVKVALAGDGGDELFCGYKRFCRFSRDTPSQHERLAEFRAIQCRWSEPSGVVLGAREPITAWDEPGRWLDSGDFRDQVMYLDSLQYLPDDLLAKVDRAAMANSLETRMPFLDHRLIEFAWRLPAEMKVCDGQQKWILRQVLYRHVPRELIDRPKMGFSIPLDHWLRSGFRDWAYALLDERRLRQQGYFNPGPIRRRWEEHLSGQRDWRHALWVILMFEAWLDNQRSQPSSFRDSK